MNKFTPSSACTNTLPFNYHSRQPTEQLPSTSSQPTLSDSLSFRDTFDSFSLPADEMNETDDLDYNNYESVNDIDDEGYTTPTEDNRLPSFPETSWVYSTPERRRVEPVCPGAPKRKHCKSALSESSSISTYSQSLPNDATYRGITKKKKPKKSTSPLGMRRSSVPTIGSTIRSRLDFGDSGVNTDEGQMSNM